MIKKLKIGFAGLVVLGVLTGCMGSDEKEKKEVVQNEASEKEGEDFSDVKNYVESQVVDSVELDQSLAEVYEHLKLEDVEDYTYDNGTEGELIKGVNLITSYDGFLANVYVGLENDKVTFISKDISLEENDDPKLVFDGLLGLKEKKFGSYGTYVEHKVEFGKDLYSKNYQWKTIDVELGNLSLEPVEEQGMIIRTYYSKLTQE